MSKKKIFNNILWLIIEKILRLSIGIYVISYVAKGLGPKQFGILSLVTSILAIVTSISMLGLKNILIKEILENKKYEKSDILYSAFSVLLCSAILTFIILITACHFISSNQFSNVLIIMSIMVLFRPLDILKDYYDSQVNSKVYTRIDGGVFILVSILKILLIYYGFGLYEIAAVTTLELVLSSSILLYYFKIDVGINEINFIGIKFVKSLLKQSWPLIISALAWIIYTKIDQLMIARLMDVKSVGIYSVATKFTDILYFIPSFLVISSVPIIYSRFKDDSENYKRYYQILYDATTLITVFISLFFFIFSKEIILKIFGNDYMNAIPVLKVNIFSLIFISMALVSGQYLVYQGKQKILMLRHIIGIVINFILNYLFIPIYGINGAAISTLISLCIANYLFDLTSNNTLICFIQKTRSFFFISLIDEVLKNLKVVYGRFKK